MCANHGCRDDKTVSVNLCRIANIKLEQLAESREMTTEQLLRSLVEKAIYSDEDYYTCSSN